MQYVFDIIVLFIVLLSTLIGFFRGFFKELLTLIVIFLTFYGTGKVSPFLIDHVLQFIQNETVAYFVTYIVCYTILFILLSLVSFLIMKGLKKISIKAVDKFFGSFFGLIRGIIGASFLELIATHFFVVDNVNSVFQNSIVYGALHKTTDCLVLILPKTGRDYLIDTFMSKKRKQDIFELLEKNNLKFGNNNNVSEIINCNNISKKNNIKNDDNVLPEKTNDLAILKTKKIQGSNDKKQNKKVVKNMINNLVNEYIDDV